MITQLCYTELTPLITIIYLSPSPFEHDQTLTVSYCEQITPFLTVEPPSPKNPPKQQNLPNLCLPVWSVCTVHLLVRPLCWVVYTSWRSSSLFHQDCPRHLLIIKKLFENFLKQLPVMYIGKYPHPPFYFRPPCNGTNLRLDEFNF